MSTWHHVRALPQAQQWFASEFDEYQLSQTSSSVGLAAGRYKWLFSEEPFWPKYLRELSKLKSEIKHNIDKVEGLLGMPGRAFKVASLQFDGDQGTIEGQELDLSRAYLTAAGLLGLIGSDTIDRISKLRKVWRLRLLGAIARKKLVQTIKAGSIVKQETIEDRQLRHAWFCICSVVDDVQQKLAKTIGADFLFYWYDNLFSRTGGLNSKSLICCSEFSYRVAARKLEYKSRPDSLAVRCDDGRVFWLPSICSHSVGSLPLLSQIPVQKLLDRPNPEVRIGM